MRISQDHVAFFMQISTLTWWIFKSPWTAVLEKSRFKYILQHIKIQHGKVVTVQRWFW